MGLTFSCKVHLLSKSVPDPILVGCFKPSEDCGGGGERRGGREEGRGRREGEKE